MVIACKDDEVLPRIKTEIMEHNDRLREYFCAEPGYSAHRVLNTCALAGSGRAIAVGHFK